MVLEVRDKYMMRLAASTLRENESLEVIRGQVMAMDSLYRTLVATTEIDMEE